FRIHLDEEYGHDTMLHQDRDNRKPVWDPILEATSSWFAAKMLHIDNLEKVVLVHLVLETSACVFYSNMRYVNSDYKSNSHVDIHVTDIDDAHAKLGMELLKSINKKQFDSLSLIQQQGWKMLNAVFNRIAALVL
ncbi:MAG: cupin domain-containing protein, partial [Gammaproteobacteria bacterium]